MYPTIRRSSGSILAAASISLCLPPATCHAQERAADASSRAPDARLASGSLVRVKLRGSQPWLARVVPAAGDSMLVRGASLADTRLIRLSEAVQVDVCVGKRPASHVARNTLIAAGVGAVAGALAARAMKNVQTSEGTSSGGCPFCGSGSGPHETGNQQIAGAFLGGIGLGAVVYLVSRRPTDEWRRVAGGGHRTAFTPSPAGGRVSIAF
jgi:hypothetical protein